MPKGLRLTLGGAPASPHFVAGVPGLYRPDIPTPVGHEGEMSIEEAEGYANDPAIPLELIEFRGLKEAQEQAQADIDAARSGIATAARTGPEGSETARIEGEAAAVTPTAPAAGAETTEG